MLATINNTVNSASVQGNQLYDPYGNNRYQSGSMTTSKGFTGQYNDNLTGLDYYGSRYYDPAAGVFLSADPLEGDLAGANPYEYVNANPETNTDPTGGMVACGAGCGGGSPMPPSPEPPSAPSLPGGTGGGISNGNSSPCGDPTNSSVSCAKTQLAAKTDWQTTVQLPTHIGVSNGSMLCHPTGNGFAISAGIGWGATLTATSAGNGCYSSGNGDATGTTTVTVRGSGLAPMTACFSFFVNCSDEGAKNGSGSGEGRESGNWLAADTGEEGNGPSVGGSDDEGGCSFSAQTPVTTAQGQQAIGSLHVGEKVLAYNPKTHKMELQPIQHVWIDKDNDLVDLTVTTVQKGQAGRGSTRQSEVIHTNKKHPFLTKEKGFLPVGQIKLGMHVLQAHGQWGIVTGWKVVPGSSTMYNLEVAHDHTFTVGTGEWVVHNDCGPQPTRRQMFNQAKRDAGIPTSSSPIRQGWVNQWGESETQRIYEFLDSNGDTKYIIEHLSDPNERGPHFHVGAVKYPGQDLFQDGEKYLNLGKNNPNIQAHYPDDMGGFGP